MKVCLTQQSTSQSKKEATTYSMMIVVNILGWKGGKPLSSNLKDER